MKYLAHAKLVTIPRQQGTIKAGHKHIIGTAGACVAV